MYKLGIDVGGTNTDAVLIDDDSKVIAEIKNPTSDDIYEGIVGAVHGLLENIDINLKDIKQTMLGTTQCTNAIVERKQLAKVGLLRIGAPASLGILPMIDWEDDIKACVQAYTLIGGGFEYDGKLLAEFDEKAARDFFLSLKGKVDSIAISCVFSTVRNDHELKAKAICQEILGSDVHITLSSEVGNMGLIERENAAILNAALYKVAYKFTEGFQNSLIKEGIQNAKVYLSQNDGTLMTMEQAKQYPVLTIACGPTNSIRGAGYLSQISDAMVIDVGGTTTDIGVIQTGFPRESSVAMTIGGVRTNFRMPDVISIGLGGGSIVRLDDSGRVTVGPDSVGYKITEKALVFGGDTLTATDIAVAAGKVDLGDVSKVQTLDPDMVLKAMACMKEMIEEGIDAMKLSSEPVDLIVVGGGSIIVSDHLKGAKSVLKPQHYGTANAIGSAIARISGLYEKLIDYDQVPREKALEEAKLEAIKMAVASGASASSVEIIDVEDVPLAYYPGNTNRVKIKAAGELEE